MKYGYWIHTHEYCRAFDGGCCSEINNECSYKNCPAKQSPAPSDALVEAVFSEKAKSNIAKWGMQDLKTLGLCVAEEAGELAQAILKYHHENGHVERIEQEADDLGALCVQVKQALGGKGK